MVRVTPLASVQWILRISALLLCLGTFIQPGLLPVRVHAAPPPPEPSPDVTKSKPESTPSVDQPQNFDELFHSESSGSSKTDSSLVRPHLMWDLGLGLSVMNLTGARGHTSFGSQLSFHEGFWRFVRVGITSYGAMTHVLLTGGAQRTFFFFQERLRIQPQISLAVLLGGDTLSGAWFNRHTLGLSAGSTFSYYFRSRWGIFFSAQSGVFFPNSVVFRPSFLVGSSHSFF